MKEEITMPELLPLILKSVQGIQDQLNDLKGKFVEFRDQLDKLESRMVRLESNIVKKDDFNNLVKILDKKKIISASETAYLLIPADGYLNK